MSDLVTRNSYIRVSVENKITQYNNIPTDINILLLQEMKPPVPLWFYPQQPNLLLSAREKGRLYNEFISLFVFIILVQSNLVIPNVIPKGFWLPRFLNSKIPSL